MSQNKSSRAHPKTFSGAFGNVHFVNDCDNISQKFLFESLLNVIEKYFIYYLIGFDTLTLFNINQKFDVFG